MKSQRPKVEPIRNVNIVSSEFKTDPFPFYTQLRSEAPVYRVMLPDKRNAWLVTRYDDVLRVLKDDRGHKVGDLGDRRHLQR